MTDVKNEAVEETVATVKDTSENPIDTSAAIMNDDGTFGGQIANVDDSKLNALTGTKPFMIRMKVKLNSAATKDHILRTVSDSIWQRWYSFKDQISDV